MSALLALIRALGPLVLKGAEAGTLAEIADTAYRLVALLRPLLDDPAMKEQLGQVAASVEAATAVRPAQPEDPVFARFDQPKRGGR